MVGRSARQVPADFKSPGSSGGQEDQGAAGPTFLKQCDKARNWEFKVRRRASANNADERQLKGQAVQGFPNPWAVTGNKKKSEIIKVSCQWNPD